MHRLGRIAKRVLERFGGAARRGARAVRRLVAALFGPRGIGRDELLLTSGLTALAVGCYQVWPPAAWLVPGAIVTWMALPSRTPFLMRPPVEPPARRER
jgi:hypothetical protein